MAYLQIISSFLFLISIGSVDIHRVKNAGAMIEKSLWGKSLFRVFSLISFVFLTLLITDIGNLKWYWGLLIAFVCNVILARIFAEIYSSFLGYKSKPSPNLLSGTYVRYNINIIDSLITFGLGLILYFIGKI